jgi:cell division septation protein DedD
MVNPYELRKGIRIEMVDTDDYEKAMDKAVKKLKKDPMFYSNLIANVKETKGKRSDVPTEVKDKKLNKVSDKLKDKANEMLVSKKDAAKKNANDSLNKKEKASGKPKGVKEMTMKPKASKGMKSMSVPGKEKKTNLKESFNLWDAFKKNILR